MAKKYAGRGLKTITVSGPGLRPQKFKICVGNHPDDVQKWIEERRKRFPRMDGSHRKNHTISKANLSNSAGMKRGRDGEHDAEGTQKRPCPDKKANSECKSDDEGEEIGGLSSLLAGYASSDEEGEIAESKDIPNIDLKESHASAEDPPLEGDETKPTEVTNSNQTQPKRLCKYYQRGNCRHGTSCKFLHSDNPHDSSNQRQKQRQSQSDRDKARNQYERELQILGLATPSHGSRYTSGGKVINNTSLLHKLLQRDKERERRMTLQLLRYIVDCDYFQGGREEDAASNKSDGEIDEEGAVK